MWHPDLEEEHPTVSLALIYSRIESWHIGLPVSLVCHYRGIKKELERCSKCLHTPLAYIIPTANSSKDCWSDSRIELVFSALERTGTVSNRDKTSRKFSLLQETSWFCLLRDERKAAGFRSRLSTPPGVNQAISPKLMSPKRLITPSLFRVLLFGPHKHRDLYLIGSGTALGRMEDWHLSAAPKVQLNIWQPLHESSLSLVPPCVVYCFVSVFEGKSCNAVIWVSAYLPWHRFCKHHFAHNCMSSHATS